MPGAICSIIGCTKSRTTKGLAIFGIPKKDDEWHRDWREKLVNIITKDRETDADLRGQIERKSLHICELHFTEDQVVQVTTTLLLLQLLPLPLLLLLLLLLLCVHQSL